MALILTPATILEKHGKITLSKAFSGICDIKDIGIDNIIAQHNLSKGKSIIMKFWDI